MRKLAIVLFILALASDTQAQLLTGVTMSNSGGGAPAPPSCSNALDFSVACNSQYINVVGI